MGFIYRIRNRITGKSYIGETIKEPEIRWKQHIACAKAGKGCPALRDAFKKHGINSFEFKVIIICFDDDRFFYERDYIKRYNTQAPNGYNILPGGVGGPGFKGKVHTEDVRKVISEKSKEMWKGFDADRMREHKLKVSKVMKSLNIPERMKASEKWNRYINTKKLNNSNAKNTIEANHKIEEMINNNVVSDNESETSKTNSFRYQMSSHIKNKISQSLKQYYKNNPNHNFNINIQKHREIMCKAVGKPVCQYDNIGLLLKKYKSISEASRESGVKKSNIIHALKGTHKTAGGFVWKYLDINT